MLWVQIPPEPLRTISNNQWPRGAAWSARLPVTQEIVGSNPIEVAWKMARYANRQSGEAQTFVTAGSTPACATFGLCSSRRPVKPSSQNKRGGRRDVQFLHNPLRPARLSVEDTSLSSWKDRFNSHAGHSWPSGVIGKHATLRSSCPSRRGSSSLPLVTEMLAGKNLSIDAGEPVLSWAS